MEKIHIAFAADDGYALYLGVALCSLFENKTTTCSIEIYILDGGISSDNREKLLFLSKRYFFHITFIPIDTSIFREFSVSRHITLATYYRILLPDLLPKLKKILYLDCDTVVIKDISKLYAMDIDNYSFAAVPQYGDHRLQDLHLPVGTKYFNSGVMLINMEWRRTSHLTKKILTFIKKNPEILMYHDQDAMNALMRDTRLPLSSKYNYMTSVLESHLIDYKKVRKDIAIIHYTRLKPWNYLCVNPLKKDYFYYLAKTPWKNRKFIDKTFKNVCIYLWRFVVGFLFPKIILKKWI